MLAKNTFTAMIPVIALSISGCQTVQNFESPNVNKTKSELENAVNNNKNLQPVTAPTLPPSVSESLRQSKQLPEQTRSRLEKRINVSAKNVHAKTFFTGLVQDNGLNVMLHPDVKGNVTLSLSQVTLPEVLEAIKLMYGYEIKLRGTILQVYPADLRTETISVNYLHMQRKGLSMTSVNSGRLSDSGSGDSDDSGSSSSIGGDKSNGTFINSETTTDFWSELQHTLAVIIGKDDKEKKVVVSPQSGFVTVHAYPHEIRNVKDFLKGAEQKLKRQVILEAKILEVTLSDGYQRGIEWQRIGTTNGIGNLSTDVSGGFLGGLPVGDEITNIIGGVQSLTIKNANFEAAVNLLNTQGDVEVLSSPRVTASNNQKAVIKVGQDEYFVTNISSTTVASTTPVTTPDIELTPFFSGIALDVTPQIDDSDKVLLHVHPSVIEVKEQTKRIKFAKDEIELPLAASQIRESDTVIEAESGSIVVIGGLMKSSNEEIISKVPFLGDIPFLGELFKNRSMREKKTELVILIKPTVVRRDTWRQELEKSRDILDSWYPDNINPYGSRKGMAF